MLIPVLPGDGIGPVVIAEALRVLRAVGVNDFLELPFGHRCRVETGEALPEATAIAIERAGVALLGAATTDGGPSPILALRRRLGLDLMVRPAAGLVLVGHAFEGLYWEPEAEHPRWVVTEAGTRRLLAEAFARATRRVTFVDKPTVLRRQATLARACAPPSPVPFEIVNADAFVAAVLRDRGRYDVVVANSFVADVLADLFAALDGGVGAAPSASLGERVAVFEPVHGSAPRRAGEDPPRVDPTGAIRAAAMLLAHVGDPAAETVAAALAAAGPHDGREPTAAFGARVASLASAVSRRP
ncbi:MAG: isocitrate/isopropylmalate family dehydrogenase [Myxococcota bacterium]